MIPKIVHESWHTYLEPLFKDPKIAILRDDILIKEKYYPKREEIFRVFEMPLDKIKVVILGQDPYAKKGQANGLAFAVNEKVAMPPSLRIVHNEIEKEHHYDDLLVTEGLDYWSTLEHWHKQGVFLLNSALTVKAGDSGSHLGYWQWFTREVVHIISLQGENPVWLMWGAKAKGYIGSIHAYYKWNKTYKGPHYNYVLEADHPAAESYGGKYKFSGCNHFSTCNEILTLKQQRPIMW